MALIEEINLELNSFQEAKTKIMKASQQVKEEIA